MQICRKSLLCPSVWHCCLQVSWLHQDTAEQLVVVVSPEMQYLILLATCVEESGLVPNTLMSDQLHCATKQLVPVVTFRLSVTTCHFLQAFCPIPHDSTERQAASTPIAGVRYYLIIGEDIWLPPPLFWPLAQWGFEHGTLLTAGWCLNHWITKTAML